MTMVKCPRCGIEAYDHTQLFDPMTIAVQDSECSYFVERNNYNSICGYVRSPHPDIRFFSATENCCPHLKLAIATAPNWGRGEFAT